MPSWSRPVVTRTDILEGLTAIGLGSGDVLMLHSSLSSMGNVEGGAPAAVEAILDLLGPTGTLVVPTLTDVTKPFSHTTSVSAVGRLTEVMRQRPGAVRSRHPTHSVAAVGPAASKLTVDHERADPCGPESAYGKLCAMHGWILLLGVDQDRNTTWHVAEAIADVPYLRTLIVQVLQADGFVEDIAVPKSPWGHRAFIGLDRPLWEAGLLRIGRVGQAVARLMPADRMIAWGLARLSEDPASFLCAKPECVFCQWARSVLRGDDAMVDWAELSQRCGCGRADCEVCVV